MQSKPSEERLRSDLSEGSLAHMLEATVTVGAEPIGVISPRIYGAFAEHLGRCCYGGLWVGPDSDISNVDGFRSDVVAALRALPTPFIRWPGGCYSEHYHWRSGIGPAAIRAASLGMSCGLYTSDSHALGTHEFMRFCELIGAEPYLAGNVATGSVQELCDWIEYVNSSTDSALTRERAANGRLGPWNVKTWGVGNESWDCGGRFDAVTYAHEYRRFARMIRDVDPRAELVAVGQEDEPLPESGLDPEWNARFLETLGPAANLVDHLSVHKYWIHGGPETDFDESQYYALLDEAEGTEGLIQRTWRTIEAIAPPSHRIRIALDEWGVWHPEARDWGPGDVPRRRPPDLEQANTLRDALAVAVALEGLHRQCNVLSMANLAQVVNVLQAPILTDGPRIALTPTYHALALHRPHVGAHALPVEVEAAARTPVNGTAVSATASVAPNGSSGAVTIVNRHWNAPAEVRMRLTGMLDATAGDSRLLTADAPNAVNVPGEAEQVFPRLLEVEVLGDATFRVSIPAHSMATIEFASNSR
jgi:alpha-N-arabinofuranosidase